MHRFYCPDLPTMPPTPAAAPDPQGLSGLHATLDDQEAHHARRVLRLDVGTTIEIFNGQGVSGTAVIESWPTRSSATLRIVSLEHAPPPTPTIDLAVAIPKGPRADAMIEALSQLGADRVIPLLATRSVVDPRDRKLDRFARAAIESAKQSERAYVMGVDAATGLDALLNGPHDLRLIATPRLPTPPHVRELLRSARHVLILVGPEGGFTEDETAAAQRAGCVPWCFSQNVLRIETAAAAALAIARHHCAD